MVGLQTAIATGCGSRDQSSNDNGQAVRSAVAQTGTDIPAERSPDDVSNTGMWVVRKQVDPLTDKTKMLATIAFVSQEQGRYQFELVVDDRVAVNVWEQNTVPVATVRVSIFDAEPTGLRFDRTVLGKFVAVKSGRYRIDDEEAFDIAWVQSDEFSNVFTTTVPLESLLTLGQRLLLTGLRSVDEVFELRRDRSAEPLWSAIASRINAHASLEDEKTKAVALAQARRQDEVTQANPIGVRVSEDGREVQTRFGSLKVVCPGKTIGINCAEPLRLTWKDKELYRSDEAQSFEFLHDSYRFTDGEAVVVAQYSGGSVCPALYAVILLDPTGAATITETFGSCSDLPRIKAETNALVFTFPTATGSATYRFADRRVTESRQ